MKKSIFCYLLIFSLIVINSGCAEKETSTCHRSIKVRNNSDKYVRMSFSLNYPDTVNLSLAIYDNSRNADPSETQSIYLDQRDCVETSYEYYIPSDTLMLFIFDRTVIENYPYDEIMKNHMYLKRHDLSLADLYNLDFTVNYP